LLPMLKLQLLTLSMDPTLRVPRLSIKCSKKQNQPLQIAKTWVTTFRKLRTGLLSSHTQRLSLRNFPRTGSSTTRKLSLTLLKKKLTGPHKSTSMQEKTLPLQLKFYCHSRKKMFQNLISISWPSQISLLVSYMEWLVTTISKSLKPASRAQNSSCHT